MRKTRSIFLGDFWLRYVYISWKNTNVGQSSFEYTQKIWHSGSLCVVVIFAWFSVYEFVASIVIRHTEKKNLKEKPPMKSHNKITQLFFHEKFVHWCLQDTYNGVSNWARDDASVQESVQESKQCYKTRLMNRCQVNPLSMEDTEVGMCDKQTSPVVGK